MAEELFPLFLICTFFYRPSASRAGGYGGSFSAGSRVGKRSGKLTPATNTDESYGDDDD